MKKMIIMMIGVLLLLSGTICAGPLNPAQVSAEAKWVVHANFDEFASSEMWWMISQELSKKDWKKIDAITKLFGSDPTKDIYGITLFGKDAKEENATVLINGKYEKEKLLSLLSMNDEYAESQYKGKTLYHWLDENDNKKKVGMFASEELIVISQSEDSVEAAADLLASEKDSLASAEDSALAKLVDTRQDAIVVMAAEGLSELSKNRKNNTILRNSNMMAVVAGEENGDLYLHVDLTAETAEAAIQIEQILGGIGSFIELKHSDEPEVLALLDSVILERTGKQLFLTVKYPSAKLFEMVKDRHLSDDKACSDKP